MGDSELVIVLDTEKDECKIRSSGSIDNPKICNGLKEILEGREEAFNKRREKYGI